MKCSSKPINSRKTKKRLLIRISQTITPLPRFSVRLENATQCLPRHLVLFLQPPAKSMGTVSASLILGKQENHFKSCLYVLIGLSLHQADQFSLESNPILKIMNDMNVLFVGKTKKTFISFVCVDFKLTSNNKLLIVCFHWHKNTKLLPLRSNVSSPSIALKISSIHRILFTFLLSLYTTSLLLSIMIFAQHCILYSKR